MIRSLFTLASALLPVAALVQPQPQPQPPPKAWPREVQVLRWDGRKWAQLPAKARFHKGAKR